MISRWLVRYGLTQELRQTNCQSAGAAPDDVAIAQASVLQPSTVMLNLLREVLDFPGETQLSKQSAKSCVQCTDLCCGFAHRLD